MQETEFLHLALSLSSLVVISTLVFMLSKKIKIPYTVLLVLAGLVLIPLSESTLFGFIGAFELTPDILFFVFLPILLFEAAYNIHYATFLRSWKTISVLAGFGVLIAAILLGVGLYFIFPLVGLEIPFLVCLLFGALISATDPVAVLSIFRTMGVSKRLTMVVEGESLFNDGTSVALFMIILGIILAGGEVTNATFISGMITFFSMIVGGIIFGLISGVTFSKILAKVNYNEEVEISLALVSAYMTFILAEVISEHMLIPISGIIATVVSSMVIGNYGRYKITPKSEAHMSKFVDFFTFLSNSLVFILLGLIISSINVDISEFLIPIIVSIIMVMISRILSVYVSVQVINRFNLEEKIYINSQQILFWGALRGVLSLMMVLMIPGEGSSGYREILAFEQSVGWNNIFHVTDFHIKDFLLILTVSSIMFTLFVKAPTMGYMMKKIGANKLDRFERFEYEEWKILANFRILEKLKLLNKQKFLSKSEYTRLKYKYKPELRNSIASLRKILGEETSDSSIFIRRILFRYALGIEKQYLKDLFYYKKIDEKNFKYILDDLEQQIEKLGAGLRKPPSLMTLKTTKSMFSKFNFLKRKFSDIDMYVIHRTKTIILSKVIKDLENIPNEQLGFDQDLVDSIISIYKYFLTGSEKRREELFNSDNAKISLLETNIINKSLLKLEEKLLIDLYSKGIVPPRFYKDFMAKIETELYNDV